MLTIVRLIIIVYNYKKRKSTLNVNPRVNCFIEDSIISEYHLSPQDNDLLLSCILLKLMLFRLNFSVILSNDKKHQLHQFSLEDKNPT